MNSFKKHRGWPTFLLLATLTTLILSAETAAGPSRAGQQAGAPSQGTSPQDFTGAETVYYSELWTEDRDLPEWAQRGAIVYRTAPPLKADGSDMPAIGPPGIFHVGPIKAITTSTATAVRDRGAHTIIRLEGQFFFGDRDMLKTAVRRPGGWESWHIYEPNIGWYEKFPAALAGTRVLRDGQLIREYYGDPLVQRRDLSYLHPVGRQIRKAYLREVLLGRPIFDRPMDLICGRMAEGVWYDNPGNAAPSYDPYSLGLVAEEFKNKFEPRLRDNFRKFAREKLKTDPKFRRQYSTPTELEALYQAQIALWYDDPPSLWERLMDPEMQEWWEKFWAEAYVDYYAWQYDFLQRIIGPEYGRTHLVTGGNFKILSSKAAWDFYLFSRPTLDILGPCEDKPVYSNKYAPGFKLALAASNGKPGGVYAAKPETAHAAEALACLGVLANPPDDLEAFHALNMDIYRRARPGAPLALFYHLEDGLHQNRIATIFQLADQLWGLGLPFEIITERHLSPEVLDRFHTVILPGFRLKDEDIRRLSLFLQKGGNLIDIGRNSDESGGLLAERLRTEPETGSGRKGRFIDIPFPEAARDELAIRRSRRRRAFRGSDWIAGKRRTF